ncbi:Uma2 family endonuclease [Aerosakkonema funiforme]|uniref:Uma2 family endonuclease n=1 Tax=Aerosakkonema funiforme FACHB-1375 TaxID=2949571 RepID=A0A926VCC2_9CYAN|nr:Uma2 family endonuclease [Aerosakkonema funiforme]MBD2179939.1 Uma2 family endonuclease [Aerosakkonema funiforme FACHB-1375]
MNLTVKDLERLQTELQEAHLDYQLELVDGRIIVMGPSDVTSSEVGARLIIFLGGWVMPRRLGRVYDSSGGFILPTENADLRAPDVSFVRAERLRNSPRDFARVVPDLMVEIKSKNDRVNPLKEKIKAFLELGSQVGILIDPDKQKVIILRRGGEENELTNSDVLTITELFPRWELPVSELWPPEFE